MHDSEILHDNFDEWFLDAIAPLDWGYESE